MPADGQTFAHSVDRNESQVGERLLAGRSAFLGFLIKRLGNRTDAEDVLQDFCVRVLSRTNQLRDAERMDAWLYAVLRSAMNDHFRKVGRRRRLNDAFALELTTAENCEESPENERSFCQCLPRVMSDLRPSDAALVQRLDLDGEDRMVVAKSLGIQPGALNVRLHRARAALRGSLLRHCGCCCENGFEDCTCPPHGRSSKLRNTHRSVHGGTESLSI